MPVGNIGSGGIGAVVGGAGDGVRSIVGTSTISPGPAGDGVPAGSIVGGVMTVGEAGGAMRALAGDAVAAQPAPPDVHDGVGFPQAVATAASTATATITIAADWARR